MNRVLKEDTYDSKPAGKKSISNWWIHLIMAVGCCCCILPFVLVLIVSFTSEKAIELNGYSFFPSEWSLAAYKYLFANPNTVLRAYGITIFVTIIGTVFSLFIGTMVAYVISRKDYPFKKALTFYIFFTMLFNGGLVPTYFLYANFLHFKDTILALIIPGLLLGGFNVLIMRTFFSSNIPVSLIESAYLDGAGDFRIYVQIVIPLSLPVIAAIGFMTTLTYWNDWYNSMIYISNDDIVSLQYLMTRVLLNIQALKSQTELSSEARALLGKMPDESIRMAMAVVGAGPMLFVFPFFQKYFINGLTIGAVKG